MAVNLNNVRELHAWNKRVLSIGGMWPLDPTFVRFYITYVYFITNVVMAIGDFINVFGNMTLMIANLSETSVQAMMGVKMMVLRHSIPLKKLLKQVEISTMENYYRDETEMKLYLEYNTIGRTFFRIGSYLSFGTVLTYHLKPFEDIIKAAMHNETIPYVLPYRTKLFFEITSIRTYVLVYLSQSPMFYYYYCHTISVCFLCTLIVHVAGELSVLAHRIRHINRSNSIDDRDDPKIAFREIVERHQKIIRSAETIDDVFNVVLLEELIISTMLIGLAAYSVLSKSLMVSMFEFFFFVNYSMALFVLILVYCIGGEFLLRESLNVHDAYYECRWYDMPSEYRKHMTICMARAQKPVQLTAGRFYVFSLSRFSGVLKTAMTYISMLRTVV